MTGRDIHDCVAFVGQDLIDLAEKASFTPNPWRRVLPAAAMVAVMLGLGTAAFRFLQAPAPAVPEISEPAAVEEAEFTPQQLPVQEQPPAEEPNPLQQIFPQLDAASLDAYAQAHPELSPDGWAQLQINEAGLEDNGTALRTTQGDQVLAVDAENGILLVRVLGEEYRGVLAIVNDPTALSLQASSQLGVSGEPVGKIAEAHNGVLAINASHFYDTTGGGNGGTLAGFALCDGTEFNSDLHMGDGYSRLEIDRDGRFTLLPSLSPVSDDAQNAVESSPALIDGGEILAEEVRSFDGLHPRACIGQTESGAVLLLVIEGRLPEYSTGASALECAAILRRYGCETAINLDGGTSAILWYDGEYVTRCSNQALPEGRTLPTAFVVGRAK